MNDFDAIDLLKKKVGVPFHYRFENERCVELDIASQDYIFRGLVRHRTQSEKADILRLVAGLTYLQRLNLRSNMVHSIPDYFANLTHLRYLDLSSNHLEKVPLWIQEIQDLEHLNLSANEISELPSFLSKFHNLKTLRLHKNTFRIYPDEYGAFARLELLNL